MGVRGRSRNLNSNTDARELTGVAIAPDLGERYLDTVYETDWVGEYYGQNVLGSDLRSAHIRAA